MHDTFSVCIYITQYAFNFPHLFKIGNCKFNRKAIKVLSTIYLQNYLIVHDWFITCFNVKYEVDQWFEYAKRCREVLLPTGPPCLVTKLFNLNLLLLYSLENFEKVFLVQTENDVSRGLSWHIKQRFNFSQIMNISKTFVYSCIPRAESDMSKYGQ